MVGVLPEDQAGGWLGLRRSSSGGCSLADRGYSPRVDSAVDGRRYEVRCYHCDTSFAPGTRRCVHCGERLGGRPPLPTEALVREPGAPDEIEPSAPPGRTVLWAVSAAIAVAASMLRTCGGG